MIRKIFIPLLFIVTFGIYAQKGLEIPAKIKGRNEQILKREGYTVSYNRNWRIPNWVAWHLTAVKTNGRHSRKSVKFLEDDEVPMPRATLSDYKGSGYDRGHMCPSGDNKWSIIAQQQSFLLTNICPQNHNLNSGDWNELEKKCRNWANKYGEIYIVAGPLPINIKTQTIGYNRVAVPRGFFKVVLCMKGKPCAIGFIYPNSPTNKSLSSYMCTVDEVEKITGIDFFPQLPDEVEHVVESCIGKL